MNIFEIRLHLEKAPGIAAATRSNWHAKADIVMGTVGGFLYIRMGGATGVLWGATFEDATADDWEPV